MMGKWAAFYGPGKEEDKIHYFDTENAAWDFVFSQMCSACRVERNYALEHGDGAIVLGVGADLEGYTADLYPACAAEWFVYQPTPEELMNDPRLLHDETELVLGPSTELGGNISSPILPDPITD